MTSIEVEEVQTENIMNIQKEPENGERGQSATIKNMNGNEKLGDKWRLLFYILAIPVQAALLLKCPLFVFRQISPRVFLIQACPEINQTEDHMITQEYIFTMVIYSGLYIGRWVEALIIHIHIYKFFFSQTTFPPNKFLNMCKDGLNESKRVKALYTLVALYMLMHCLSIPILGIVLEMRHGHDSNCEGYVYQHHTVYWLFDIIRYLHDVVIRLLMFLATIALGMIWSREQESGSEESRDQKEPMNYSDYLNDREITSEDHKIRMEDYIKRGKEVERVLEIFQTWFTIPWVLYFIGSSLDADHILRSWKDGSEGSAQYDFSEVTYMVYNFNQLFLLTLAYLCSKKMNTQHYNYFCRSRDHQLTKFQTASRVALASMNKIEKEDHFDFVPRIWGTSIKIQVDSPLYIVFLLISIFFTVVEALI